MEASGRSKKFMTTDSLFYEQERLNTFINWPVPFLSPKILAANGFYYLRSKDHCACVFCRGIVGAWERGDSPDEEHRRHFPGCPFINGGPTANVALSQGRVLEEVNISGINASTQAAKDRISLDYGIDECGSSIVPPPPMVTVCKAGEVAASLPLSEFKLQLPHQLPKRRDLIKFESRKETFSLWPNIIGVSVDALVEAGFYYIGLSDHVRCYYCGNGLRNWEKDDDPWVEHARWYPQCEHLYFKKGPTFISRIQELNPPYQHTPPNQPSDFQTERAELYTKITVGDEHMENLMQLPVVKVLRSQGFPDWAIRDALKPRIEDTGVPFLSLYDAVDWTVKACHTKDAHSKWHIMGIKAKAWLENWYQNSVLAEEATSVDRIPETPLVGTNNPSGFNELVLPQLPNRNDSGGEPAEIGEDVVGQMLPSMSHANIFDNDMDVVQTYPSLPATQVTAPDGIIEEERGFTRDPIESTTALTDETASQALVEVPTQSVAEIPTQTVAEIPTQSVAEIPTQSVAEIPTQSVAEIPTQSVVEIPTQSVVEIPTQSVAEIPTQSVVDVPTQSVVEVPTQSVVDVQTELNSEVLPSELMATTESTDNPSRVSTSTTLSSNRRFGRRPLILEDIILPMREADRAMENAAEILRKDPLSASSNSSSEPDFIDDEGRSVNLKDVEELLAEEDAQKENRTCRVCMDNVLEVVFLPCTHMVSCGSCALALTKCPICRTPISYALKPILS